MNIFRVSLAAGAVALSMVFSSAANATYYRHTYNCTCYHWHNAGYASGYQHSIDLLERYVAHYQTWLSSHSTRHHKYYYVRWQLAKAKKKLKLLETFYYAKLKECNKDVSPS